MPTKLPLSMSPLSCPVSSQVVILVSIIIGFWFVFRHPGEVQPSCILGESEPWAVVVSTAWGACDSLSKHGQAVRVCVTCCLHSHLQHPVLFSSSGQMSWRLDKKDVLCCGTGLCGPGLSDWRLCGLQVRAQVPCVGSPPTCALCGVVLGCCLFISCNLKSPISGKNLKWNSN